MLIARINFVIDQVKSGYTAASIRCREIQRMIVIPQSTQCFALVSANRIIEAFREFVIAGIHVGVEMIFECAGCAQRWAVFGCAEIVAGEAVALRRCMQIVQMHADFWRTKTDMRMIFFYFII